MRQPTDHENIQAIRLAYAQGKSSADFLPAVFVVEPTSACNLNCIMCPQSSLPEASIGEMAVETASELAQAMAPTAELTMLYFMGEPLLHTEFCNYVAAMREHLSSRLVISTNAMGLDDREIDGILDNGVDVVLCCIDRWNAAAYESTRRGASFATVVANTERLLERRSDEDKPVVIVKALDLKMPKTERAEFEAYWTARGAVPLVGWLDTWAGQRLGLLKLTDSPPPYSPEGRTACADLWFKMVINWRCQAVLCCHNFDYSYVLGEIGGSESIGEIWQGEELRAARASHLGGRYASVALCGDCREWGELPELEAYLSLEHESLGLVF